MNEVFTKLLDLVIEQLRKSGLNTILLVCGIVYFAWKYDGSSGAIIAENTNLKEQIKVLDGTIIAGQQKIHQNQEEIKGYLHTAISNQEKILELARYKNNP